MRSQLTRDVLPPPSGVATAAFVVAISVLGALVAGIGAAQVATLRVIEDVGTVSLAGVLSPAALGLGATETIVVGRVTGPQLGSSPVGIAEPATPDLAPNTSCDFGLSSAFLSRRWVITCQFASSAADRQAHAGERTLTLTLRAARLRVPVVFAAIAGAATACVAALASLWAARRYRRQVGGVWPAILDDAGIASWVVDTRTDRLHTSDCWNSMLGYSRADAPTTGAAATLLIHPDDRARVAAPMSRTQGKAAPLFGDEFRIRRVDGSYLWVLSRATLVLPRGPHGNRGRMIGINADIHERKSAEANEVRRAAFLKSVLSSLSSHVAVLDATGRIVLANDSWTEFAGTVGTLAERPPEGSNYLDRLAAVAGAGQATAEALAGGVRRLLGEEGVPIELECETRSLGVRSVYLARLSRFVVPEGLRVTITFRDITAIRLAEEEIRESRERWRFAIEGSGDAIWEWDVLSQTVTRSPQLASMLGIARPDGLGADIGAVMRRVHADDSDRVSAAYEAVLTGGRDTCAVEQRVRHEDGSWRWLMTRCTVVKRDGGGRALRLIGVHTDISHLKEVERRLREQGNDIRMLAKVAEHTTNSVLIVDNKGDTVWVNRGFERMTGFSLADIRGRPPAEVLQGPDTDVAVVSYIAEQCRTVQPVRTRILHYRKDRTPFWTALEIQPVVTPEGELEHFVAVMEDLTQRERLEADLRLSQKLESVGQLAAGIAHEINTPIQFIGDSVAFLAETWRDLERLVGAARRAEPVAATDSDTVPPSPPVLSDTDASFILENFPEAISRARDGVQRVTDIVRAMREFAHPAQGHFSGADLNHALENALVVSRNELKYVGTAYLDLTAIPPVRCRIGAVNQVLLNLIINASHALADQKHTPQTGRLTVSTRLEDAYVVIAISDNGSGIPDAIRERIFDPFFTTKEVGRGTGQGLAIARSIVVDQHEGRISVDSRLGQGTTFEVWLAVEGPTTDRPGCYPAAAA
jgi:PAS domain S-box-containing protein